MKRVILSLVVAVLLGSILLTGCSEPEPEPTSSPSPTASPTAEPTQEPVKTTVLRMATYNANTTDTGILMAQLPGRIKERTGGRYDIEIYWSDSLVPMFEIMDAVREGAAEMGDFPFGPFASQDQRFASAETPFSYTCLEAMREGCQLMLPEFSKVLSDKFNQVGMVTYGIGFLEAGCPDHPIKTLEDWEGVMCQSISPQMAGFLEAVKATGASIPPSEVYQSMEKGIIDATMQAPGKYEEAKLYEICKNVTIAFTMPAACGVTINKAVYDKMSAEDQQIFMEEGAWLQEEYINILLDSFDVTIQELKDYGMDVYFLPKAERDRWEAAVKPYVDGLLGDMGDFGVRAQEIFDEVNNKYPYPY